MTPGRSRVLWWTALAGIVILGLALRLKGIGHPILDHPGWRQGDTAAIARNFARLDMNPLHPQVDYNGAPPNYVELELQIVPWLAALGYRIFGVHEVFGRLLSIAFSLGTTIVLAWFARWLFRSAVAGVAAAALFASFPGAFYYGRTFTPDTTMTFFLTAAVFAGTRFVIEPVEGSAVRWQFLGACALLAAAFLAKPVALVAIVPLVCAAWFARERRLAWRAGAPLALIGPSLVLLWAYSAIEGANAEWHWASGIVRKHVLPSLVHAATTPSALVAKIKLLGNPIAKMLWTTMLGPLGSLAAAVGIVVRVRSRADAVLWGWLAAGFAYAFVVVTVERVDYYLYPLLPLAALFGGGACALGWDAMRDRSIGLRIAAAAAACIVFSVGLYVARRNVAAYYVYKPSVYAQARALSNQLAPGALVVVGHYDPAILYYIDRKGWEEDPYLWTPFSQQSAIRKGARYFIAIEANRLKRNVELDAWLARFPQLEPPGLWPIYVTDPAHTLPGAEALWRAFRNREKAGLLPRSANRVPTTNGQLIDPTNPQPALTAPP